MESGHSNVRFWNRLYSVNKITIAHLFTCLFYFHIYCTEKYMMIRNCGFVCCHVFFSLIDVVRNKTERTSTSIQAQATLVITVVVLSS